MQEQELLAQYRQLSLADQQQLDSLLTKLLATPPEANNSAPDNPAATLANSRPTTSLPATCLPTTSQPAPSASTTPQEVMRAWIAAFNQRDAAALAELYHEEAVNLQVAIGTPIQGKAAIYRDALAFFEAFPDNFTQLEQLLQDGDWVVVEWSGGATWKGEFAGLAPNGRTYTLQGCGFFHIVAGKIRFQRGYWDKATWFGQLAIPFSS
jgi:steroid delta-isomerase-like uncharacterized protein